MTRQSYPRRILAVLARVGVPMRADEIATVLGEEVEIVATSLANMHHHGRVVRFGDRGNASTGSRRTWAIPPRAVPDAPPSNVVPIRPAAVAAAPRRMLPVIRRDDCVHEPECMMAAAKAWPEHEGGLTCPWECSDYQPAPKRVAPHPSNWMGGE